MTPAETKHLLVLGAYRDNEVTPPHPLLARDGFVKDREVPMRKRDGTPIWCAVTATAHQDASGRIEWIDGVVEDVTDRKRLEEQLRHSQKMEAIGTLAGGGDHPAPRHARRRDRLHREARHAGGAPLEGPGAADALR